MFRLCSLSFSIRVYLKSSSANLILSWHFVQFWTERQPLSDRRRLDRFRTLFLPLAICFALFLVFFHAFVFLHLMNRCALRFAECFSSAPVLLPEQSEAFSEEILLSSSVLLPSPHVSWPPNMTSSCPGQKRF